MRTSSFNILDQHFAVRGQRIEAPGSAEPDADDEYEPDADDADGGRIHDQSATQLRKKPIRDV